MGSEDNDVKWARPAMLQIRETSGFWVGKDIHFGDVASALRYYLTQAPDAQDRCDMFIGVGVVAGMGGLVSGEELRALAARADLPLQ